MLSKEHIEEQLTTGWAARNLVFLSETGSTNDDAKRLGEEGAPHGTLVVADKQNTGRGSRGRSWETTGGTNIAMSLLLRPEVPIERVSMLTLVMGLSVSEGIEEAMALTGDRALSNSTRWDFQREILTQTRHYPQIKWPNDIVIAGRKICGILTELHMNSDNKTINNVVIGVGINVNTLEFSEGLKDIAGSIYTTTGMMVDRGLVIACCMKSFEINYEEYCRSFDLSSLKDEYERRLINMERLVMVLDPKGQYEAITHGITKFGALVVSDEEGEEYEINAGEVSVRGLYSYT